MEKASKQAATEIFKGADSDGRLKELGLTREGLNQVREAALGARANPTSFFPVNAPGTFAYHYGIAALREQFMGGDWVHHFEKGVEGIRNDKTEVIVLFCGVDVASNDYCSPKPLSKKGAGAERACQGNLFHSLPTFYRRQDGMRKTFYLMVDPEGNAELSCPIVEEETFTGYVERIYLGKQEFPPHGGYLDEGAIELDPIIARK